MTIRADPVSGGGLGRVLPPLMAQVEAGGEAPKPARRTPDAGAHLHVSPIAWFLTLGRIWLATSGKTLGDQPGHSKNISTHFAAL